MSELKEFLDIIFTDIRGRVESEYQHHLTTHVQNISSNLDGDQFTENYGEILSRNTYNPNLVLPKPLPGRWWIHYNEFWRGQYNGSTIYIYDNYGQCFTKDINNQDKNFSNEKQQVDSKYQYPLPDSIINFVKSQGTLTNLHILADAFHAKMVRSEVKPAAAPPCSKTSRLGEVGSSCCCTERTGSSSTKQSSGWTSSAWMSSSAYS